MYSQEILASAFALFLSAGVPTGEPARLTRASATRQGDKVVIQFYEPATRAIGGDGGPRPDGTFALPSKTEQYWSDTRKVDLGKTVKAFGVDGKELAPAAVLKALAEPRGVAVFVRRFPSDPTEPHAFYRAMLREGTLILVYDEKDIYPQGP